MTDAKDKKAGKETKELKGDKLNKEFQLSDALQKQSDQTAASIKKLLETLDAERKALQRKYQLLEQDAAMVEDFKAKMVEIGQHAKSKIKLNVGGKIFMTSVSTLMHETSVLSLMFSKQFDTLPDGDGEYFIDRNPKPFELILEYLRTRMLPLEELSPLDRKALEVEVDYYQIGSLKEMFAAANVRLLIGDSKLLKPDHGDFVKWFGEEKSNKKITLQLLYRGSRDGFTAQAFHQKCDGQIGTLPVVKSRSYPNVFGGFTNAAWSQNGQYVAGTSSWLFSLVNAQNTPAQLLPINSNHIYNNASYGPTFGSGHDLFLAADMTNGSNYTNPATYTNSSRGSTPNNTFLAGAYNFQVEEVEVHRVTIA